MTGRSQLSPPRSGLRGRPFTKGRSGNPGGRPKGALNKSTILAQSLLDGEAEALVKKVIQLALEGDLTCLRICMQRLVPPRKDAPVEIDLPDISSIADIQKLFSALTAVIGAGEITAPEIRTMVGLAEGIRKWLEVDELEKRISALEGNTNSQLGVPHVEVISEES